MDEPRIEAAGLTPIAADLATIDDLTNPDDLPVLVAYLHSYGVSAFFRFGSTDRPRPGHDDDCRRRSGRPRPARSRLLPERRCAVGRASRQVPRARREDLRAGRRAARKRRPPTPRPSCASKRRSPPRSLDRVKRRDPASTQHHQTINELQALTPNFNWRKYATAAGAPPLPTINVAGPGFLTAFDQLIASTPVDDLKTYLRWQSPAPVRRDAAEGIRRRQLRLLQPHADRPAGSSSRDGAAASRRPTRVSARRSARPSSTRRSARRPRPTRCSMVQEIKDAMRQDIDAAPWMSGETKKAAMVKLDAVVDRIGYPDDWRDYSQHPDHARRCARQSRADARPFNRVRNLEKIGQPVDRDEWSMTPPTVNAYYSPDRNNINFPAGILQPPFYKSGRDAAVNYGGGGRGHRPRADARLRRSGTQVRRAGQPARLVDGRRRQGVRRARARASPISTPATPSPAMRTSTDG